MTKLPVISPYIMGNPPKIIEWRLMETSEANHQEEKQDLPFLVIVGKRGKMRRRATVTAVTPGGKLLLITWIKSDIR